MWIFTNKGFFSIVASPEPGKMLVRARIKGDIENALSSHGIIANVATSQPIMSIKKTVPKTGLYRVMGTEERIYVK